VELARTRAPRHYTTFGSEETPVFRRVRLEDEVRAALAYAPSVRLAAYILGAAARVFLDSGFPDSFCASQSAGWSCATGRARGSRRPGVIGQLVQDAGWWRRPSCRGIPGTMGGTPIQSAEPGQYHGETIGDGVRASIRTHSSKRIRHAVRRARHAVTRAST